MISNYNSILARSLRNRYRAIKSRQNLENNIGHKNNIFRTSNDAKFTRSLWSILVRCSTNLVKWLCLCFLKNIHPRRLTPRLILCRALHTRPGLLSQCADLMYDINDFDVDTILAVTNIRYDSMTCKKTIHTTNTAAANLPLPRNFNTGSTTGKKNGRLALWKQSMNNDRCPASLNFVGIPHVL